MVSSKGPRSQTIVVFSVCFLLVVATVHAQLAPVPVQTPKAKESSIRMAESLTNEKEAVKDDTVREVLEAIENEESSSEEQEVKTQEFRSMTDLLAWSVKATLASNESDTPLTRVGTGVGGSIPDLDEILAPVEGEKSELDLIKEALAILVEEEAKEDYEIDGEKAEEALMNLEELCHSVDNAQDLMQLENAGVLLKLLNASAPSLRSASAWALATCMQNNLTVQRELLRLGVLDKLVALALEEKNDGVRGKTLFALLCLAEFEDGRQLLEEDDRVVQVLEGSIVMDTSARVVRRALNMGEVLVQKAGSFWKPRLIAVGKAAERVMRESSDEDVRESAARFVKALYSMNNS